MSLSKLRELVVDREAQRPWGYKQSDKIYMSNNMNLQTDACKNPPVNTLLGKLRNIKRDIEAVWLKFLH